MIVTYSRKSTEDEGHQVQSIRDQNNEIEKFVKVQGLGKINKRFEESHSASGFGEERKVFVKMIKFCESNGGGKIICWDKSRLGRFANIKEYNYWIFRLQKAGWEVLYVNSNVNYDGSMGSEFAELAENFQHSEFSKKLSKDVVRGVISKVNQGSRPGGRVPYGYDTAYIDTEGKLYQIIRRLSNRVKQIFDAHGKLVRTVPLGQIVSKASHDKIILVPGDRLHVQVVRRIFESYVHKSMGLRTILIMLNKENIPSPNGKKWSMRVIAEILENPAYMGKLVWNKKTQSKHHMVKSDGITKKDEIGIRFKHNKKEWIVSEGQTHELLIPEEIFERAQQIKKSRNKYSGAGRPGYKYLCSGLIICTNCGAKWYGACKNKYYLCHSFTQFGECMKKSISVKLVDNLVAERVAVLVNQRVLSVRENLIRVISEKLKSGADGVIQDIEKCESRLKQINAQISNLIDCISPENKDMVNKKLSILNQEKQVVEEKLAELLSRKPPENPTKEAEKILNQVEDFYNVFINGEIKQKKELLRIFVDKIELDPLENLLKISMYEFPKCTCFVQEARAFCNDRLVVEVYDAKTGLPRS